MHNPILQLALEKHKYVNISQKNPSVQKKLFLKITEYTRPGGIENWVKTKFFEM